MTCDVARNRLLALPDPSRPTDDLLPHLADCAACRAVQADAVRLDRLLKHLPVPSSAERKAAFLAELEADGPVIRSRPVLPSTLAGSGAFKPVTKWLKRIDWRYVGGGVAAAVVVGLAVLFLWPKPHDIDSPLAEKPRSELLAQMVKHNTALATTATTPDKQVVVYAEYSADLKAEAGRVYKVAERDEMNSLASLYEKVVTDGVVKQAELIDEKRLPPDVRSQALTDAMKKLAAAEKDASDLAADAPPNARPALDRIAKAAKSGRQALSARADGKANADLQPNGEIGS